MCIFLRDLIHPYTRDAIDLEEGNVLTYHSVRVSEVVLEFIRAEFISHFDSFFEKACVGGFLQFSCEGMLEEGPRGVINLSIACFIG